MIKSILGSLGGLGAFSFHKEKVPGVPLDRLSKVCYTKEDRMGAKRPTLIQWLEEALDELVEQLSNQENLGWHHLGDGDQRFQTYLRTATWIQETEAAIASWYTRTER